MADIMVNAPAYHLLQGSYPDHKTLAMAICLLARKMGREIRVNIPEKHINGCKVAFIEVVYLGNVSGIGKLDDCTVTASHVDRLLNLLKLTY